MPHSNNLKTYSGPLDGTCGVNVWYNYNSPYGYSIEEARMGGIGYAVAGFVNESVSKQVFEHIKEKKEVVFCSPVKTNRNSGNKFFFVVFKNTRKKNPNPNLNWPFK